MGNKIFITSGGESKNLTPEPIHQAVIAHIRHTGTDYDKLLMQGIPRSIAREAIKTKLDQVVQSWQ